MDNQTTTTITDVKWTAPKKNNTLKVLGGIVAVLLVAGIAVGAYFVSTRVSSQQAIAPTAPESEPLAAGGACSNDSAARCQGKNIGDSCGTNEICVERQAYPGQCTCREIGGGACPENVRNPKAGTAIKFNRAGVIYTYTQGFTGNITLSRTGRTITINSSSTNVHRNTRAFSVTAGEILNIRLKWSNETANAYGWIKRKTTYACGPTDATCGTNLGIKPLISLAQTTSTLTGIGAGAVGANVQCWADALQNDVTQDYDFNDGAVVFGYKKAPPGACRSLKVFKKKADGTYQTAPIATSGAQLNIGDKLKLQCTANRAKLQARFKVQVDGVDQANPVWRMFVPVSATSTIYTFSDYTVAKNGTHKFISQVSTKPVTTAADSLSPDTQAESEFVQGADGNATGDASLDAPPEEGELVTPEDQSIAEE